MQELGISALLIKSTAMMICQFHAGRVQIVTMPPRARAILYSVRGCELKSKFECVNRQVIWWRNVEDWEEKF